MTDTIEKVTLENAAEQLKAKIRLSFVELLPDDQWKAMITAELKRFTQPSRASYDSREIPSVFSAVCTEVFTNFVKSEIRALMDSPEWRLSWDSSGKTQVGDAVKSWLTDNSAALIQATVQALAASAAQHIVSGLSVAR